MNFFLLNFFLYFTFLLSFNNILLSNSKYNYIIYYKWNNINQYYQSIIDTYDDQIILLESNNNTNNNNNNNNDNNKEISCISREIDQTSMNYTSYLNNNNDNNDNNNNCLIENGIIELTTNIIKNINVSIANTFSVENDQLHSWSNKTGIFGLNYLQSSTSSTLTSFQQILSLTNSTIFGLDFNNENEISSLQLGGISDKYKDDIIWSPLQTIPTPVSHTFFLVDLTMCDTPLMSNWSNTWPVIIDTTSICLTLPSEYYHLFKTWLNSTLNLNVYSLDDLPYMTFSVNSQSDLNSNSDELLYISLTDLLVNSSDIFSEKGPIKLITLPKSYNTHLSLCVLEGDKIYDPRKTEYSTPPIIFGSLILRSLYFASNFQTYQIGFANKKITKQTILTKSPQCSKPIKCIGQNHLIVDYNICMKPLCAYYYYVNFNPNTGICEYNSGAYVVGILFLTLITFFEILTYFTSQYTFLEHTYYSHSRFKPDFITQFIGYYLTKIFDCFIYSILGWRHDELSDSEQRNNLGGFDDDDDDDDINNNISNNNNNNNDNDNDEIENRNYRNNEIEILEVNHDNDGNVRLEIAYNQQRNNHSQYNNSNHSNHSNHNGNNSM